MDNFIAPATYVPAMPTLDQVVHLQSSEVGRIVMEFSEKSAREIIHQYFENDAIRAMLLYLTCMWGLPYDTAGMGYLRFSFTLIAPPIGDSAPNRPPIPTQIGRAFRPKSATPWRGDVTLDN